MNLESNTTSDTDTSPIAVGIGVQKEYKPEILKKLNKVILLEGIKDAGNLGTIIRSAAALEQMQWCFSESALTFIVQNAYALQSVIFGNCLF